MDRKQRRLSNSLVKCITIKTCIGIYDRLKMIKPEFYQNAPSDGLELTVNYVDTMKNSNDHFEKIIVAIHGMPGSFLHFDKLIDFYRNTNVRVVIPNLPDFSHTRKTRSFWHSTKEKSVFIKDFLAKLNITTIDCLISHSFGIQTIAAIWEEPGNLKIKSVALISPQPLWDPAETDKIKCVFRFKNEWWYNLLSFFRLHKIPTMPMKLSNINEFLHCCTIVVDDNTASDMTRRIELLITLNIPVILLYGSAERLISKNVIAKLNEKLTIKPEEIILVDPELPYDDLVKLKKKLNSFVIKNGGHFSHCNYHGVTNKIIDNLLNYQENNN